MLHSHPVSTRLLAPMAQLSACCQHPFLALPPVATGRNRWRVLLQKPLLDLLPGTDPVLIHVHPEENAQPTGKAACFLLQKVGLGFTFETCRKGSSWN